MTFPVALVCVALIAAACFCFWAHLRHQAMALQERSAKAVEAFAVEVGKLQLQIRAPAADSELADRITRLEIGAGLSS